MRRITLKVAIEVQGPVITRSSAIGDFGVDAPMAKGTFCESVSGEWKECFYLPGRLVKGLLREAWQELSTIEDRYAKLITGWLGEKSSDEFESPQRGRLVFGDFPDFGTDVARRQLRYRIKIDEARGAADTGMLQVMDSPYRAGKLVTFQGCVRFLAGDREDVNPLIDAVHRGLLWIRAVGGARTSGFGQVADVKLETSESSSPPSTSLAGPLWNLRLSFEEPLILSKRPIAGNFFDSSEIVPGGALKGALAEMIARDRQSFAQLSAELHLLRFTHAFPAASGGVRPLQWPLSLLSFGEDDIVNAIGRTEPFVRESKVGAFDIDWKEPVQEQVRQKYNWPAIQREIRVRTAIESETRRSKDEQLFGWRMLVPRGLEWVARVDCSGLSPGARQQLHQLFSFGLEPIGKSKTFARVSAKVAEAVRVDVADRYVVTLQTPALLIDPSRRLAPGGEIGSTSEADLQIEFRDIWDDLSDGSLELVNYFQRSYLAGGRYFARRFLKSLEQYKPYLVSSPGSTFLLRPVAGRESDAIQCLASWSNQGLPLSQRVCDFYGIPQDPKVQWEHCPYLPENGYGEITVNQSSPYPEA